jgi:hypothetical protein
MERVRLEDVVDELYGMVPSSFTARRDELAAQARQEGDRDTAARIKALKRPSAAAWAVNLMARERAEDIGRLVDLGARMREAQEALSGEEMRALGRQRQQLVAGLARQARALAREWNHALSDAAEREVQATFEAALGDADAGSSVRAGRLVRSLVRTGMDPVDLSGAVAGAPTGPVSARGRTAARTAAESPARSRAAAPRAEAEAPHDEVAAARRRAAARAEAEEARRAEEEARRVEEEARRAEEEEGRAREGARAAAEEHEAASALRRETENEIDRLEEELAAARQRADEAAAAEREARRRRARAEDEAERAADAAGRARERARERAGG